MNKDKTGRKDSKKMHRIHIIPKMSTEAQTVLQEIRAIDTKTCTGCNKSDLFHTSFRFPKSDHEENDGELSNKDENSTLPSLKRENGSAHEPPNALPLGSSDAQELDSPFVITFPGFDIRYNVAALRPGRESPNERERNMCMQKISIAKCKEWLKKC